MQFSDPPMLQRLKGEAETHTSLSISGGKPVDSNNEKGSGTSPPLQDLREKKQFVIRESSAPRKLRFLEAKLSERTEITKMVNKPQLSLRYSQILLSHADGNKHHQTNYFPQLLILVL